MQWGPLSLAPEIRITDLGYDSNVFAQNDSRNPAGDFTMTATPAAEAWLRLPRAQVSGRTEFDYIYYQQASSLRSWDSDSAARVDVFLARVTPYAWATLANLRHRQGVEIDAPIRRIEENAVAGAAVRLSGKTSIDIRATRSRSSFEDQATYFDITLAQALNRKATGEGASVKYSVTPFTTVSLDVDRERERFDFSPERDANTLFIGPAIEMKPFAVISGRARLGLRKRTFLDAATPPYRTVAALVDLRYTLQERTGFSVEFQRDLRYSYRVVQQEYVLTGFRVGVMHRLADPWDVRASVGRDRLEYGGGALGSVTVRPEVETVLRYRAEVGYRVGRTRVGVHVDYRNRDAELSPRR
ncbi:MAG TPA: outer membrane beta-barrel protein, partial [Thermomicrobiales bacterium]|nr:outer membrane beta-barrel protein [Thermomicrobiales bacterium]